MDRSEIESFIEKFYAARVDGDMDALGEAFSAGAKFTVAGSPEFSILATTAVGQKGVMALLQTMTDTFALEDFEIVDMLIDGNKAAVRWRATAHLVTSGQSYETELADFIEIKDGKVVSFTEFLDTALAG